MYTGGRDMDKSFKECFAELCSDRASDAIVSARQNDAEYIEAMDKLNAIRAQFTPALNDGNALLFAQLVDAYSYRQICETRLAYEQGMRDGLRLNKIVGGVA